MHGKNTESEKEKILLPEKEVNIDSVTEEQFKYIFALGYNQAINDRYFPLYDNFNLLENKFFNLENSFNALENNHKIHVENVKLQKDIFHDREVLKIGQKYNNQVKIAIVVTAITIGAVLLGASFVSITPYNINLGG